MLLLCSPRESRGSDGLCSLHMVADVLWDRMGMGSQVACTLFAKLPGNMLEIETRDPEYFQRAC